MRTDRDAALLDAAASFSRKHSLTRGWSSWRGAVYDAATMSAMRWMLKRLCDRNSSRALAVWLAMASQRAEWTGHAKQLVRKRMKRCFVIWTWMAGNERSMLERLLGGLQALNRRRVARGYTAWRREASGLLSSPMGKQAFGYVRYINTSLEKAWARWSSEMRMRSKRHGAFIEGRYRNCERDLRRSYAQWVEMNGLCNTMDLLMRTSVLFLLTARCSKAIGRWRYAAVLLAERVRAASMARVASRYCKRTTLSHGMQLLRFRTVASTQLDAALRAALDRRTTNTLTSAWAPWREMATELDRRLQTGGNFFVVWGRAKRAIAFHHWQVIAAACEADIKSHSIALKHYFQSVHKEVAGYFQF